MADLFREVDEVMRQERMQKLWNENRIYIVGFVLGTILLTGLISGYHSWNDGVKEKQTAQLIALQDAADYPDNILNAEKLDLRAGLRGVALLQGASAFLNDEKTDEALKLYKQAAADKRLPAELRHLGILMETRLLTNKDGADGKALLETLHPVLAASGSPWLHHARLEAAVINANLLGDYETALAHLNEIQDTPDLPNSLYQRARALSSLYTTQKQSSEKTG